MNLGSLGALHFDQCLVTISPGSLARLAPDLPGNYLHGLLELKNMGAVVMILALKHGLSEEGYYWYNIPKPEGFPFLSLVEHTNFLSPANFGGDHIVYLGDYLETGHEYFRLEKEELLARFLPWLAAFQPQISTELDQENLAFPYTVCPAHPDGEPFQEYSGHPELPSQGCTSQA